MQPHKRRIRPNKKITESFALFVLLFSIFNLRMWAQQTDLESSNSKPETSSSPVTNIITNTVNAHTGYNSFYHFGAIGATGLMIGTDADAQIYKNVSRDVQGTGTEVALVVGNFYHLIPATMVYFASDDGSHYEYSSAAVLQALAITAVVTITQKIITGRLGPKERGKGDDLFPRTTDPTDFNFRAWENFDLRKGRFFWPSGHTASAMTTASALAAFYPEETWLHVATYSMTGWMAYSMLDGSHHWGSDIVAGALIGHIIGWTVGKDFRRRYANQYKSGQGNSKRQFEDSFYWQPVLTADGYGVRVGWSF